MRVVDQIRGYLDKWKMGYRVEPITQETLQRWIKELDAEELELAGEDEKDEWERMGVGHG